MITQMTEKANLSTSARREQISTEKNIVKTPSIFRRKSCFSFQNTDFQTHYFMKKESDINVKQMNLKDYHTIC